MSDPPSNLIERIVKCAHNTKEWVVEEVRSCAPGSDNRFLSVIWGNKLAAKKEHDSDDEDLNNQKDFRKNKTPRKCPKGCPAGDLPGENKNNNANRNTGSSTGENSKKVTAGTGKCQRNGKQIVEKEDTSDTEEQEKLQDEKDCDPEFQKKCCPPETNSCPEDGSGGCMLIFQNPHAPCCCEEKEEEEEPCPPKGFQEPRPSTCGCDFCKKEGYHGNCCSPVSDASIDLKNA